MRVQHIAPQWGDAKPLCHWSARTRDNTSIPANSIYLSTQLISIHARFPFPCPPAHAPLRAVACTRQAPALHREVSVSPALPHREHTSVIKVNPPVAISIPEEIPRVTDVKMVATSKSRTVASPNVLGEVVGAG
ncbi:hypothetical protein BU26DRAFT_304982 [Trematosphaeria pertusa]|uniref:Uncharacterized protein n=1 Tax=Trematosphaeria pertusa TaxID=390896 RepID=A0A6A6IE84_9PLEO|nr:uncharacterized protein BU26DRAFT_304982 [Trematosphaeria pertusa]KAF2248736.1 hypothetical protein BU26DRAFT_304982 [Trematosphaeria pertusa]